jgi:argininosuccinate lyase
MWRQDIRGSLAHATMLARQGIISTEDLADIQRGMAQIVGEIESGSIRHGRSTSKTSISTSRNA